MNDKAGEKHFTESEVAALWHVSRATVRKLFKDQPGVVEFGTEEGRYRRPYRSRRIPESVMIRVHQDLMRRK